MRALKFAGFGLTALVAALGATTSCTGPSDDCETLLTCLGGSATSGSSGDAGDGNSGMGGKAGASGTSGGTVGGEDAAGGGDARGGEAGAGMTLPCNGTCAGDKPLCKEVSETCVQCLLSADCKTGANTKCDTTSNTCVECLTASDCKDAKAAKCDGAGACAKCTVNEDCAHVLGKTVCDTKAGECVQCTAKEEEVSCAGNSCNPVTRSCTNTPVGSLDYCRPCVADSECLGGNKADPDARCVPMQFNGTPRDGGFCLRRVAKICSRPYKAPFATASLSGAPEESYCGIDQENVRCEAVLDMIGSVECADGMDKSCGCARSKNGKCTDPGDGLCRTVGATANRCSYSCGTVDDCPIGTTCTGALPYCH